MSEEKNIINDNPFSFSKEQLSELVDPKNPEELERYGGVQGIAKGLKVDLNVGIYFTDANIYNQVDNKEIVNKLNEDEKLFYDRLRIFGQNILPEAKSRTILELMWLAMHDNIMILLTVAALISLSIGIYEEISEEDMQYSWIEGLSIIMAVFIVIFVGSVNDYQKEKQFRALNAKKEDRMVKVLRHGEREMISIYDVCVGDILVLEPGDILCADGVFIDGHNLKCDESAATGESDTIKKNANGDPFLISGSKVTEGVGECLVIAVGCSSFHGKTMMSLRTEDEETPLQLKLNDLAEYIAKIGTTAAVLMFIALLIKYIVVSIQNGFENGSHIFSKITEIFISAITIVVVAVPEGLPLAVTLALAFATTRMLKDNNLVRVLNACETMGGATTICSDKTGTLTQNRMTVVKGVIGQTVVCQDVEELKNLPKILKSIENYSEFYPDQEAIPKNTINLDGNQVLNILSEGIAINSSAFEGTNCEGEIEFIGSKTEVALLEMIQRMGLNYKKIRQADDIHIEQIYPFSSEKKSMSTIIKVDQSKVGQQPIYRIHVKGASEIVLNYCSSILSLPKSQALNNTDPRHIDTTQLTTLIELNNDIRKDINTNVINKFAAESLRTICLAYRDFTEAEYLKIVNGDLKQKVISAYRKTQIEEWKRLQSEKIILERGLVFEENNLRMIMKTIRDEDVPLNELELINDIPMSDIISHPLALEELACSKLICLGIVGIEDPVRPGVPEAVLACQRAGVFVRMVTGDNINTATAIATKCGIYTPGGIVMEGINFRKLSDEEMDQVIPRLQVLARSSPTDKQLLVSRLKALGETVAVTGDGTNDGPALKMADVGFSMGIAGTEVAKEASSIILMDDNFSSIVKAILWGRSVNDSVKKFLQFQLTVNITAVIVTFISAMADGEEGSALNAIQLLWVNLIMDTLAALALATEKPTQDLLERPPQGKSSPLISTAMWKMILGQAIFQIIVNICLLFVGPSIFRNEMENLRLIGGVTKSARIYCTNNPGSIECLQPNIFANTVESERKLLKTMVFNTFVLMQLFNEINCRRIDNKLNVFKGIFRNAYFLIIFISVAAVQVLIIFFGSEVFKTIPLNFQQWLICIGIAFISIPLAIPIRLIPDSVIDKMLSCLLLRRNKKEEKILANKSSQISPPYSSSSSTITESIKVNTEPYQRTYTDSSNITTATSKTTSSNAPSLLRTLRGGRLNTDMKLRSNKRNFSMSQNNRSSSGRIMTSPADPNVNNTTARVAWNRAFRKVQQQKFSMSA